MKKIIYSLVFLTGLFLTSCGGSNKNLSITTKEDLQKAKQVLVDKLGAETEMLELSFNTKSTRKTELQQGLVMNKTDYFVYMYEYDKLVKQESPLSNDVKNYKPLKLSDFNVDEFLEIKAKAIALIQEKSKDFTDFTVEDMTCSVKENGERVYRFTLVGVKTKEGISYVGNRKYPKEPFYQFDFSYQTDVKKLESTTKGLN